MTPARNQGTRGFIVPVGGAEEKIGDVAILRRFAALCGGRDGRVAIIPTASELTDTGARYEEVFRGLGGRPYDEQTGLQNHHHRWYSVDTGRWISEDPIGFGGGHAN